MSNNTLIFLRHAETKVDKRLKISKWLLTNKGKREAIKTTKLELFKDIDIIITSDEEKAFLTSTPLAKELKEEILREKKLNEILRDKWRFLEKNEYLKTMKLCLTNREKSFNKWETAEDALKRFSEKIEEIDSKYYNKKILIVSHGGVINLYFAKIIGQLNDVYKRVQSNTFCDYGIIQDGRVIKDIAKVLQ